jgi:endoglucanase
MNNATDGDLLIVWALTRASRRWNEARYVTAATAVSQDIRRHLLRSTPHGVVLLPGKFGFEKPTGLTLNLSYWIFPAFADLQRLDPSPDWEHLRHSGERLLQMARFGRWQLPPDWLAVHDKVAPAPDFQPVFGYNAIRIPLYLVWGMQERRVPLAPYLDFWNYFRGATFIPAWTNLTDNCVDSYNASLGIRAVVQLAQAAAHGTLHTVRLPPLDQQQDYYSASLLLLAKLAQFERSSL